MKTCFAPLFAVARFALVAPALSFADEPSERIAASFVLALGRAPSADDVAQWTKQGPLSVAELLARHRQQLQSDAAARRATIIRAGHDAFGRAPTDDEIATWADGDAAAVTYTERMGRHLHWLAAHPAEYELVLHRAYQLLVRRNAYPEEIEYWKRYDTMSFALLVGCIEDWARRNQPGLMVTNGTATISVNSEFLTTVRLSTAVAAEARIAAGLTPVADAATAPGRHLVAAGAGQIVTGGRIHFVAAGAAHLVP